MRIKGFLASDMRQAIRKVREELGPDAVILSSRNHRGGVELTAAVDYDDTARDGAPFDGHPQLLSQPAPQESIDWTGEPDEGQALGVEPDSVHAARPLGAMGRELRSLRGLLEHQLCSLAWGEIARSHPIRAAILRRLLELGFSRRMAQALTVELPEGEPLQDAWRRTLGLLAHRIRVSAADPLDDAGVVALLGATGVGKTTTVAKLAARCAMRHGAREVALITTDSYRVGAFEQLRVFGRIMDVPVRVARDESALRQAVESFAHRRTVLIDTAGIGQRDARFADQVTLVRRASCRVKTHLVLSATAQMLALDETVRAFQDGLPDGCVITKLDEATSLGAVLSVISEQQIPIAYATDGQRVPEDISPARSHRLVSRAIALHAQSRREQADESLELAFGGMVTSVAG
jgi:flagellar biosynthesis protein FlhF